ncbi:hypothetical protein BASA50_002289 [Batrachochytrium salamandrivorans]|uniref:Membrane-associated protein n=1 Tax=Batrachochytrium salamandrivorans TaxID=1357716 RepID=A0ABQ8FLQ8_9FUNG|nr:hypothetical protein BASA60_009964 [Batrachochytrium salamandrivorans]KAH6565558.1 hypothetical protein BASA62_007191 [Batrachochytrium salamandrivorans]KAH6582384.1 hypothetical protein BASA61_008583 [Batrachochytrium salamandrivorans]KAH6600467.1 hypothetical protein BASA50_002289 [Batrachochytrium salamandrivorans]KAH9270765.1 hypothetical protein BASA83_007127 [Batrachochytrium salamandrivorans]
MLAARSCLLFILSLVFAVSYAAAIDSNGDTDLDPQWQRLYTRQINAGKWSHNSSFDTPPPPPASNLEPTQSPSTDGGFMSGMMLPAGFIILGPIVAVALVIITLCLCRLSPSWALCSRVRPTVTLADDVEIAYAIAPPTEGFSTAATALAKHSDGTTAIGAGGEAGHVTHSPFHNLSRPTQARFWERHPPVSQSTVPAPPTPTNAAVICVYSVNPSSGHISSVAPDSTLSTSVATIVVGHPPEYQQTSIA